MTNKYFKQINNPGFYKGGNTNYFDEAENSPFKVNQYENLALPVLGSVAWDIAEQVADQEDKIENEILVLTRDDGLVHNYFHYFECYWDALDCLSTVILRFPKTDRETIGYWSKYQGDIYIYSGKNFSKARFESDEAYDIESISPIFVGQISHIREYYNQIEIYVHNIGSRFKQKIPEEFRNYYIFNQNVRDAFQAMCEFLGVKYICPPQNALQNESDADVKLQEESQVAGTTEQKPDMKNLAETANQVASSLGTNNLNTQGNQITNETTQTDPTAQPTTTADDIMANGFANVSFDAGGNLTYNSTIIESSPDMAQTLVAMETSPMENYEGFDDLLADIDDFLNGKVFETVHNNVMDYGAITVVPQTTATSTIMPTEQTEEQPNGEQGSEQNADGQSGESTNN